MCCHNRNNRALRPRPASRLFAKSLPLLKSLLNAPRTRQVDTVQAQDTSQVVYRYPTAELAPQGPPPAYELASPAYDLISLVSQKQAIQPAEHELWHKEVEAPDTRLGPSARTQYVGAKDGYHGDVFDLSKEEEALQIPKGQDIAAATQSGSRQPGYRCKTRGRCAGRIKEKQ